MVKKIAKKMLPAAIARTIKTIASMEKELATGMKNVPLTAEEKTLPPEETAKKGFIAHWKTVPMTEEDKKKWLVLINHNKQQLPPDQSK